MSARRGLAGRGWLAALGKQRQAAMPGVVEANRGEACPLEQRLVVSVDDVLGVGGRPVPGGEDEPLIIVGRYPDLFWAGRTRPLVSVAVKKALKETGARSLPTPPKRPRCQPGRAVAVPAVSRWKRIPSAG